MERLGLVLAGGGGKGAYQIGVWKYLRECGLDQHICAVSGTSVGALNAALFAAGDYERAEDIWLNIALDKILTPKEITFEDVTRFFTVAGITPSMLASAAGIAVSPLVSITNGIRVMQRRRGIFSREGLAEIINYDLDFHRLYNDGIPCYATCFGLSLMDFGLRRFNLQEYSKNDIRNILLASSAIPVVFEPQKVRGVYYCDGGIPKIGDNVPVQPLYDDGIENIIVVHLGQDSFVECDKYEHARIFEITPQKDLGGAVDGTLDFTKEGAKWRIEQGYQDVKKVFDPFVEMVKRGKRIEGALRELSNGMRDYERRKEEIERQRRAVKNSKAHDGFEDMCEELGV